MNQSLLFLFSALIAAPPPSTTPPAPAAIVYALTGEAFQTLPGQPRNPIALFDRLPAGADLEVAPHAHLALAFASGKRWALGGGAHVTLGAADLRSRAGDVRALPAVPPFPHLARIREHDHAGPRAGAVRIRGERIKGLYPSRGAAALASTVVLLFRPVEGADRYRIEVQDRQGTAVFAIETSEMMARVPAGTLQPGHRYSWTVRTLDRPGGVAQGEAEIVTLNEDTGREEAREVLAAEGSDSLPLLAEIDRSLELWLEAREDLRAALDDKPGDPALRKALAEIEARLEHEDDRE